MELLQHVHAQHHEHAQQRAINSRTKVNGVDLSVYIKDEIHLERLALTV